jgi:predicted nucleic acid-binding protein
VIIVETTVWVDYFNDVSNPQTDWLERNLTIERMGLFDLILFEILQGIRDEFEFAQTRRELHAFPVLSTGGADFALAAAIKYRALRRRGVTVRKTVDTLIATACIEGGHQLLHNDRDYEGFEKHLGLKVIHP